MTDPTNPADQPTDSSASTEQADPPVRKNRRMRKMLARQRREAAQQAGQGTTGPTEPSHSGPAEEAKPAPTAEEVKSASQAADAEPSAGQSRSRPRKTTRPPRDRVRDQPTPPKRLAETPGPDPATPVEDVRLTVGFVVGAHGLEGDLRVQLVTDDPEHLMTLDHLYLGDEPRPRRVLDFRLHTGVALLRFHGIDDPDQAMTFQGQTISIRGADARPLAPGEYYHYQLIGLRVVTETGEPLGAVTDLIETGAHDVFVVTPDDGGPDQLYPNHPDIVPHIDPSQGQMTVRPLRYWDDAPPPETPSETT